MSVSVVQVAALQQCSAASLHVDCFNCDATWLASGTCMPGVYYYQYTLTNTDGYSAVPVNLTVEILEQACSPQLLFYASTLIMHELLCSVIACIQLMVLGLLPADTSVGSGFQLSISVLAVLQQLARQ